MSSMGRRRLLKHRDKVVGGGLVGCSTMLTTSSLQLRHGVPTDAPNAASSTMGSHERGKEYTEDTKKIWSNSRKLLALESDDSNALEVSLSPRDGRVLYEASEPPPPMQQENSEGACNPSGGAEIRGN
jgi:hypothetical protein